MIVARLLSILLTVLLLWFNFAANPAPKLRGKVSYAFHSRLVHFKVQKLANWHGTLSSGRLWLQLAASKEREYGDDTYILAAGELETRGNPAFAQTDSEHFEAFGELTRPPPGEYFIHMALLEDRFDPLPLHVVTFNAKRRFQDESEKER